MSEGEGPPRGLDGLVARNGALELALSELRPEMELLRDEVEQLRRFRDAVWLQAVGDLEDWAQREGMALEATATHDPPPSAGEVITALAAEGLPRVELDPELAQPRTRPAEVREERRAAPRYAVDLPVRFAAAGVDQTTTGTLVELSDTGLKIRTADPAELGTRVACGLYVQRGAARELVLARGEVVRHLGENENGPGFALRLEQITVAPQHLVECLSAPLVIESSAGRRRDESTIKLRFRPTDVDPVDE